MSETSCATCPLQAPGTACPACGRTAEALASLARPTLRTGKTENLRHATLKQGRSAPARAALPGALAARFEDLGVLGTGGMGVVVLARDRQIGREVAIKLIAPGASLAGDLKREATLLATLEDERVVRLYEYGVADGAPYIVMEYVRGETLFTRLMLRRPPLVEALGIARDVTRAVQAAHARGVIHSDLKPANVFLASGGLAKVADFGLARPLGAEPAPRADPGGDIRLSGIAGTPGYMAPEQAQGQVPGAAADVYAIGVMLHEMLTGQRLFTGRTVLAILRRQAADEPAGPAASNPGVPLELDALVRRCLARDPAARPAVGELAQELEKWEVRLKRARALPGAAGLPPHPYKFLEHFDAADARIFFGRESEVAELTALLTAPAVRMVLVFGPCGVGKSSLVRAGLVRALADEQLPALVVNAGPDPAERLAEALKIRPDARVAIVDQLDELFTMNRGDAPAVRRFLELAIQLAEDPDSPVKVVLSFRSEFRAQLFALETRLARLAQAYAVGPLSEGALADAIEGPSWIETYGFELAPGFARTLTRDILETVAERGESAPALAQIVCRQLYDHARASGTRVIDAALYQRVLGGVRGALKRYVEERLTGPAYGAEAHLARQLLRALTQREGGGERYARPSDEDELLAFPDPERARRVLGLLVADRLVTTDEGEGGRRVFRLCSEVLCPLIDAWGADEDEAERAARVLQRAVRAWVEHGRRAEDLPAGNALALVEKHFDALRGVGETERALLAAALRARRARRAWTGAVTALVALVVGAAAYMTLWRPGRVSVASEPPGAEVFAGEDRVGETPLVWEARPGVHQLTLRKERYADTALTVRVPAGGEASYAPVLAYPYGLLAVESEPDGASCTVTPLAGTAGSPVTTTTPVRLELPAGAYGLRLAAPGHVDATVDRIALGANRALAERRVKLVPDHGWLDLDTPFPGTSASLRDPASGAVLWTATLPVRGRQAPRGRFEVEASMLGHHSQVRSVEVTRGATATYTLWTPEVARRWKASFKEHCQLPRATVDLDHDGVPDLVAAVGERTLQAVSGRDGHVLFGVTLDTTLRADPVITLAALDLDGHGRPGMAAGCVSGALVFVDLVDHRVIDRRIANMPDLAAEQPLEPRVADLDGDGASEVITMDHDVVQLIGGRDRRVRWSVPVRAGTGGLATGDLDGDGYGDVIVAAGPFYAQALSGRDGHVLWTFPAMGPPGRAREVPVAAGDLTGAGHADVVLGGTGGAGGLAVIDGRTGALRLAVRGTVVTGLVVARFEGRPAADIAVVLDGALQVLDGVTGETRWRAPASDPVAHLVAVDFRGDRKPALVMALQDGRFLVYDGASGRLLWSVGGGTQLGDRPAFVDVDSDGCLDLVCGEEGGFTAFSGAPPPVRWAARPGARAFGSPMVADVDGDREPDVIALTWPKPELALGAYGGASGRELWRRPMALGDASVAAGAFTRAGASELALASGLRGVEVLSAADGSRRWGDLPGGEPATEPLPVPAEGGRQDVVVRLRPRVKNGPGRLARRDGRTGRELWRTAELPGVFFAPELVWRTNGAPLLSSPVFDAQRRVHVGTFDVATGAPVDVLEPALDAVPGSWVAGDLDGDGEDELVAGYASGVIEAWSRRRGRLWSAQSIGLGGLFPGKTSDLAPPALAINDADDDGAGDVVVCSAMGILATLSGRTGKPLWVSPDAVSAQRVVVAPADARVPALWLNDVGGRLQVRDGATGKLRASMPISESDTTSPLIFDTAAPWPAFSADRRSIRPRRGPAPASMRVLCVGPGDTWLMLPALELVRAFAR